jgi:hypothetical protein
MCNVKYLNRTNHYNVIGKRNARARNVVKGL